MLKLTVGKDAGFLFVCVDLDGFFGISGFSDIYPWNMLRGCQVFSSRALEAE